MHQSYSFLAILTMVLNFVTLLKVVKYINNAEARPSVFVSATAIGYYGTSKIHTFDESSPSGNDYLAEVCREWEARAREVNQKDVRLVLLRIGFVLGKDGGALAKMIPLFMMFARGPLGTGRQWFSWIHLDDLVNLIYESLTNPTYKVFYTAMVSFTNFCCPFISCWRHHQVISLVCTGPSPVLNDAAKRQLHHIGMSSAQVG